jgi:hypothetical protein
MQASRNNLSGLLSCNPKSSNSNSEWYYQRAMLERFSPHRSDWILALLYVDGQKPVRGTVRIMKELFLFRKSTTLDKKAHIGEFYKFVPYDYGPCSFELYDDLDVLRTRGHIVALERPNKRYRVYLITDEGAYRAYRFLKGHHSSVTKALNEVKKEVNDLPLYDLLSYVYEKYPKYAKKTVFGPF